jgi:hypothetical protein
MDDFVRFRESLGEKPRLRWSGDRRLERQKVRLQLKVLAPTQATEYNPLPLIVYLPKRIPRSSVAGGT